MWPTDMSAADRGCHHALKRIALQDLFKLLHQHLPKGCLLDAFKYIKRTIIPPLGGAGKPF